MDMGRQIDQTPAVQSIINDNGYKSRKFVGLTRYWLLVLLGYVMSIQWPAASNLFIHYCAALTAGLAAYYGVNWARTKTATQILQPRLPKRKPKDETRVSNTTTTTPASSDPI
jgi:hypothetical protein